MGATPYTFYSTTILGEGIPTTAVPIAGTISGGAAISSVAAVAGPAAAAFFAFNSIFGLINGSYANWLDSYNQWFLDHPEYEGGQYQTPGSSAYGNVYRPQELPSPGTQLPAQEAAKLAYPGGLPGIAEAAAPGIAPIATSATGAVAKVAAGTTALTTAGRILGLAGTVAGTAAVARSAFTPMPKVSSVLPTISDMLSGIPTWLVIAAAAVGVILMFGATKK
jgi:hypothetical protein